MGKRITSPLEFVCLIKLVQQRISTLADTAQLAAAITTTGEGINTTALSPPAMFNQKETRVQEVQKLASAISAFRIQYWHSLSS